MQRGSRNSHFDEPSARSIHHHHALSHHATIKHRLRQRRDVMGQQSPKKAEDQPETNCYHIHNLETNRKDQQKDLTID